MILHRWVIRWTHVATTTAGSEVALPVGNWQRTSPAAKFGRGWGEIRGKLGSPSIGFGFEVANDVETPSGTTRVSTLITADGVSNPSGTPTAVDLDGVKFVRPVIFVKAGTEGVLAGAMAAGVVEIWSAT